VLLCYLTEGQPRLVFKGDTCLAKVHFDFLRLSEDLDFVIPTTVGDARSVRRQSAAAFKRAMAEKLRAALTRRDVAIRDLYDLDHADPRQDLDLKSRSFIALVRKQLAVPGSGQVDISEERLGQLKR